MCDELMFQFLVTPASRQFQRHQDKKCTKYW